MMNKIRHISIFSGRLGGWAAIVLLCLVVINVILRFVFQKSFNALMEMEWHLFGLIFLLGGCHSLLMDKHVRVDFFYADFSQKLKNTINLFFHCVLLLPWIWVGLTTCYRYADNSFYIKESSPNPGGLPAMYPIKYLIVLSFLLLLLQVVSDIYYLAKELKNSWKS